MPWVRHEHEVAVAEKRLDLGLRYVLVVCDQLYRGPCSERSHEGLELESLGFVEAARENERKLRLHRGRELGERLEHDRQPLPLVEAPEDHEPPPPAFDLCRQDRAPQLPGWIPKRLREEHALRVVRPPREARNRSRVEAEERRQVRVPEGRSNDRTLCQRRGPLTRGPRAAVVERRPEVDARECERPREAKIERNRELDRVEAHQQQMVRAKALGVVPGHAPVDLFGRAHAGVDEGKTGRHFRLVERRSLRRARELDERGVTVSRLVRDDQVECAGKLPLGPVPQERLEVLGVMALRIEVEQHDPRCHARSFACAPRRSARLRSPGVTTFPAPMTEHPERADSSATRVASGSVVLVQTAVPEYRREVVSALAHRVGERFELVAGGEYFDRTVTSSDVPGVRLRRANNRFVLGRRLLWQSGVVSAALGSSVVVCELNPRTLSTWALLLARGVLRRPTVLWGHAWPRRGARASSDHLRHVMRLLATTLVVYSETQARELRSRMPRKTIVAAPNALYMRASAPRELLAGRMQDFLFVGRLVPAKKPELLVEGFSLVADDLPARTRLVFVGDGPLRDDLAAATRRSRATTRIELMGEVTSVSELQGLYGDALASVVPGYAGLSLIQSFWFGVPALIARSEPHSPEIEAAVPGANAEYFDSDSPEALGAALKAIAADRETWIERRTAIAHSCATSYSVDAMVDSIVRAVESASAR